MARWKVSFDWNLREGKVRATFFAEVEVYAENEDEAVEKARSLLEKKLETMSPGVLAAYRLSPTLDAWIPGKYLMRQLEELRKRGIEPELTEEGKKILEGA